MDYSQYESEIHAKLQPLGDPSSVAFMKNYMKSQLDFLAIKVPVLRQIAREGFSFYNRSPEDILGIWNAIWFTSPCFEVMSMPLFYYERQGRKISPAIWPTLSTWSERVENWAHSDSLASIYSDLLAQNFDAVYSVLQQWNNAENQWLRRLSMVSLIHYSGKKAVFLPLDKVLPMLENCLDDERPYVQKAIGWVLREANYVYHAEISAFVEQHLAHLRGIAFSAATERFSEAERSAFLEKRKAMRAPGTMALSSTLFGSVKTPIRKAPARGPASTMNGMERHVVVIVEAGADAGAGGAPCGRLSTPPPGLRPQKVSGREGQDDSEATL